MKTNTTLWTSLCIALIPLFLANPSYAQKAEGQSGNGGGGIHRNGRYMTFYSAGLFTEANEAAVNDVPQLKELLAFFSNTPLLSATKKANHLIQIMPSQSRKYFKVAQTKFTPAVRARLVAEYGRIMKIDFKEVTLFAITDTNSKNTYLFPEFYNLSPSEQQAILYHEAYWLLNPTSDYNTVVNAEMAFQAYIENPSSVAKLLGWLQYAGSQSDVFYAAIHSDIETNALNGLIRYNQFINLEDLFGKMFFDCRIQGLGQACSTYLTEQALALTQRYPKSQFLKLYLNNISSEKYEFGYINFLGNRAHNLLSNDPISIYELQYIKNAATCDLDLLSPFYKDEVKFNIDLKKYGRTVMQLNTL